MRLVEQSSKPTLTIVAFRPIDVCQGMNTEALDQPERRKSLGILSRDHSFCLHSCVTQGPPSLYKRVSRFLPRLHLFGQMGKILEIVRKLLDVRHGNRVVIADPDAANAPVTL